MTLKRALLIVWGRGGNLAGLDLRLKQTNLNVQAETTVFCFIAQKWGVAVGGFGGYYYYY